MMALMIQAVSTSVGHCASWRRVSDAADDSRLSTDAESRACLGSICSASERTERIRPLADGAYVVIDEVQYDCARALTRTLAETAYDAMGGKLRQVTGPSPWSSVQLETVGFRAMQYACRALGMAAPEAREDASLDTPHGPGDSPSRQAARSAVPPWAGEVQVIATPDRAEAERTIVALQQTFPPPPSGRGRVQRATVRGRVIYRGVFRGFGSEAAASTFCSLVLAGRHACLLRPAASAAARSH